ncbi:MAG: helix-turn-helix transcriptional regulator [Actinobacteria bacterium]|nr:helix-turn-helix transcriptional regulator [Actinomycetota bacterium]
MEGVEWEHHRVDFQLGPGDIQAVRFGISPGHELAHAVRVLLRPEQYPLAWGWLKDVRGRLPRDAFGLLAQVIGADGYLPDFLTATARWDLTPEEELAALRAAPMAGMRVDLGKMVVRSSGRRQEALRRMQEYPLRARSVIADAWAEVWESAMAPVWPQLERILRADVAVRSRTVATEGLATMASGIHPWVSWGDGSVRVRLRRHSEDVDCRGSGLVLVPSVMSSWSCMVITEPPAQPTLFYPAQGVTAGWAQDTADQVRALEVLVGPARAGILLAAHVPRTTSRVAEEAGIAASTASHHLTVLRDAGLIVSTRDGARMMHLRSPLGEALVGAAL